ncbi:hypothetical protein T12_510 [Trichinella patagoniensis]|uniref:Uncharacterized protein n=1 Tax=Trichinella patagoniensis TaxID=990121 RepID=A0A0V0YPP8_9BILA|nr:hypothetical protein T12_510 [Trichinella patagoniensis]
MHSNTESVILVLYKRDKLWHNVFCYIVIIG